MNCEKLKSRPSSKHRKSNRGFTLLEVIIALGIVAVGILAVSRVITGFAETTISLEQRLLANWVASNRLETHRILKIRPVIGVTHGSEEMADQTWYFRETTAATADPYLFRIDITVYADREETEEVGSLYGYLLNARELNLPIITSERVDTTYTHKILSAGNTVGSNLFEQSPFSQHQRANKFAPTERHRDSNIVGSNLFEQGIFFEHLRANEFAPTERHRDRNIVGSNLFEQSTMGFGHET